MLQISTQKINQIKASLQYSMRPDVAVVYIFGSQASGIANHLSDVDIGVLLDKATEKEKFFDIQIELIGLMSKLFGTDDIDVVILNSAPIILKFKVIQHGKVLYERDAIERIRFEVKTTSEYIDFVPILKRNDDYLYRFIKEGKYGTRSAKHQRTLGKDERRIIGPKIPPIVQS